MAAAYARPVALVGGLILLMLACLGSVVKGLRSTLSSGQNHSQRKSVVSLGRNRL
jgi:hypothetical protein